MNVTRSDDSPEHLIKAVARSGIIIFAGSLIGKILRFLFYIIVIRVLGASLYGIYSLGQGIIDIVTNVAVLGDGKGLIRFGVESLEKGDLPRVKGLVLVYLASCLFLSFFIALLIYIFSGYISIHIFHEESLAGVLKVFAIAFPFYIFSLASIPVGYVFRKVENKVMVQEIFQPLASIIFVAILFSLGWRLYGAVWAFVISSLASAFLGAYLIIKAFPGVISKTKAVFEARRLLVYSVPVILILFSYYFIFRIDRLILGMYRSAYEVGIYSAVSNMAIMVLAFSSIFEAGFAPVITQLSCGERSEELKKIFALVTVWGSSLVFLPVLGLIIFNAEVLSLFGPEFRAGGLALIVLVLAFFVEIIPGQLKQLFQMSSRQNLELVNSLAMIAVNIVLNAVLVPRLGMLGAALAMLFTFAFISLVRLAETSRLYHFSPFTLRYLKLLFFIFCSLGISLRFILQMNLHCRILAMAALALVFIFLSYKLRSNEDVLVWKALKQRILFI